MTNTPASTSVPEGRARTRSAGHIVAIVVGLLLLFPGLGMLAGGGALAIGQAVATDDDGYFRFTPDRITTDGVAIATNDVWIDDVEGDAGPWVLDFLDVDLRLRVDGARDTTDVFVGIARADDVAGYLDGVLHSEVVELNDRTPRYREVDGSTTVESPGEQDFWVVSAAGTGEQDVEWDARGGRWSVVVMNTDGAAGVAADVEIGVRSGAVTPVAVGVLILGGVVTSIAIVLLVIGIRGRRRPDVTPPTPYVDATPVPGSPVAPTDPAAATHPDPAHADTVHPDPAQPGPDHLDTVQPQGDRPDGELHDAVRPGPAPGAPGLAPPAPTTAVQLDDDMRRAGSSS